MGTSSSEQILLVALQFEFIYSTHPGDNRMGQ